MQMSEIRDRAQNMGLAGIGRFKKGDLIRTIQENEGNQACFGADWRFECPQLDCCWRKDCLSKNPG